MTIGESEPVGEPTAPGSGASVLKRLPEVTTSKDTRTEVAQDAAQAEAQQLNSGRSVADLKRQSEANEHDRSERFRDHFENIAIIALWSVAAIFVLVGCVWFWHLIAPTKMHWLDANGVSRLQNLFTGGIIAAVVGGHVKKRLGT